MEIAATYILTFAAGAAAGYLAFWMRGFLADQDAINRAIERGEADRWD